MRSGKDFYSYVNKNEIHMSISVIIEAPNNFNFIPQGDTQGL